MPDKTYKVLIGMSVAKKKNPNQDAARWEPGDEIEEKELLKYLSEKQIAFYCKRRPGRGPNLKLIKGS